MSPCPCCGFDASNASPDEVGKLIAMGRIERRVFDILVKSFGSPVSTDALIDAAYFDNPNGGPENAKKCIDVFVCRLNKKLKESRLQIRSEAYGGGRRMSWIGGAAN